MPLFRVSYDVEFFVAAESEAEAVRIAELRPWDDGGAIPTVYADEVRAQDHIPLEWLDSYPYGPKCEHTCREIMIAQTLTASPAAPGAPTP